MNGETPSGTKWSGGPKDRTFPMKREPQPD